MGKTKHRHHDGRQRLPFGIDVKRLSKKKGGKRAERRKKRKKKGETLVFPTSATATENCCFVRLYFFPVSAAYLECWEVGEVVASLASCVVAPILLRRLRLGLRLKPAVHL